MDKEVCFLINGDTLFLDKVLVSFNDTPIYFVCCDNDKNFYLALCVNIEELEYIVVQCPLRQLYQMLSSKIEMRMPFVSSKQYWSVKAGVSVEEDVVQCVNTEYMDLEVLPYPNAFYEAKKKDDVDYVEGIAAIYLVKATYHSMEIASNLHDIVDSMLEISLSNVPEINQYFDVIPLVSDKFTGITKKFEVSIPESKSFLYTEYMEQNVKSSKDRDITGTSWCDIYLAA